MEQLYYFINYWTEPLYSVLYNNSFFFIDYWSFIHLLSGALIVFFARRKNRQRYILLTFYMLMLWEVVEISFIYLAVDIFKPEALVDQVTDIVIGMTGCVMSSLYLSPPFEKSFRMFSFQKQRQY